MMDKADLDVAVTAYLTRLNRFIMLWGGGFVWGDQRSVPASPSPSLKEDSGRRDSGDVASEEDRP